MKYTYSVPVEGSEEDGYTAVYRNPNYKDKLLSCEDYFDGKIQTGWDVFQRGLSLSENSPCIGKRTVKEGVLGDFEYLTYREVEKMVKDVGSGLLHLNKFKEATLKEFNDTKVKMLGIYSVNTPEWLMCEQVCNAFGLTLVPLYDTLGEQSTEYILNTTELSVVVCDNKCAFKLLNLMPRLNNSLSLVVVIGVDNVDPGLSYKNVTFMTWNEVVQRGRNNPREFTPAKPTDVNTISYTSGVSGVPKGVIVSQHQHTSLVVIVNRIVCDYKTTEIDSPRVHLSYLPLSHMYERLYISCSYIEGSVVGVFSGDVKNVLDDIKTLKPNVFPSVPRLYMRIHDKVFSTVSQKNFLVKMLFNMGLNSKLKKIKRSGEVTHRVWDKILFKKFKRLLGGNVEWMLTGSAPLSPKVFDNIRALFSIPLISGYGLTETCAGAFHTEKYDSDSSHVGGPVPTMEFRLKSLPDFNYYVTDKNPRGELLLRGYNIVKSYYRSDETNRESFENGWFLTGDIAELLPNGAIRIIDRRKNIFKLSQGEYISPEKLEAIITAVPVVCQAYVTGKSEYLNPVAVVVPDELELELWAKKNNCSKMSRKEVASSKQFKDFLTNEMKKVFDTSGVKGFEKVKTFHIDDELFAIENDLLTTTNKLKRLEKVEYRMEDEENKLNIAKISGIVKDGDITACKTLILNDGGITQVEDLYSMKSLEKVTLCNNKIRDMSVPNISKLVNLEVLILSHNNIESFKSPNTFMNKLKKITLSHNKLREFPISDKYPVLAELRLNSNKILTLPNNLELYSCLKILDLGNNQIVNVRGLYKLSNLKDLNLSNNPSVDVKEVLSNLKQLKIYNSHPIEYYKKGDSDGVISASNSDSNLAGVKSTEATSGANTNSYVSSSIESKNNKNKRVRRRRGLVTTDLNLINTAEVRPAVFLSSMGYIACESLVFKHEDSYYLDTLRLNCSALLHILKRRKLGSKVNIGLIGSQVYVEPPAEIRSLVEDGATKSEDVLRFLDVRNRFFGNRYYRLLDATTVEEATKGASTPSSEDVGPYEKTMLLNCFLLDFLFSSSASASTTTRVSASKVMLFDLNLDKFNYINHNKGCYVGQETVNRILNKILINKYRMYLLINKEGIDDTTSDTNISGTGSSVMEELSELKLVECLRKSHGNCDKRGMYVFIKKIMSDLRPVVLSKVSSSDKGLIDSKKLILLTLFDDFGFVLLNRNTELGEININSRLYSLHPVT
ncbi:long-chain-fatty-acid--CoA ligase 5 [Theileria orientalis strain Shintoku]|uniref:Long-chain-fatty-acid--CoA ligase 5 n=1 Tax=Theileria orientalis strain Shintoku TaxID=869250 RepID=J4C7H0_THEOR|nr:long-chain-fatty-acid--CoA ligase 5 [Theileria orientalis strain Shintoku]BAM39023.1 long-chain-fatty-acid--CoA ligase 5 [Theileria orientalis strain Shintoku]|eukprot:XP_009689324.1 long-chain-fatty-acid--CoA ligase 5 [Theileria orientalis strain Shintoku]